MKRWFSYDLKAEVLMTLNKGKILMRMQACIVCLMRIALI